VTCRDRSVFISTESTRVIGNGLSLSSPLPATSSEHGARAGLGSMARGAWSILVALLALPVPLPSQEPLSIVREFVLPTSGLGVGNAIIAVRGGGFAAVGYADAGHDTGTDVLLVRFDADGDTLWTRFYGGDREDFGWDLVEAPAGGFFIAGFTEAPTEGREDVLVLRVDASGGVLWERTFGGPGRDRAWSATLAADGGIVIAAETERMERGGRDAYILNVGADGETRWARTLDVPGDQRVFSVARTDDDAYVVTGTSGTDSRATRDVYVARIDAEGNTTWTRTYGGDAADDVGHGVMALAGGDVLVTGYGATRASGGGTDIYLLRITAEGDLRWWRHFGAPAHDHAMMSAPLPGGGQVSVGFTIMPTGSDIVIVETDSGGHVQSRTTLERPGDDRGVMIHAVRDGSYVVVGTLGRSPRSTGNFAVLWLARDGPSERRPHGRPLRLLDTALKH
jgi:hypothetical protein